jgi:hypothetical protein
MKKFIIVFSITIFLSITNSFSEQWRFYPTEYNQSGEPSFFYDIIQIDKDSLGNLFFLGLNEIDVINTADNSQKQIQISYPQGMTVDKSNNLWITSIGEGLVKYDGKETISMCDLLTPYIKGKDIVTIPSCDDDNNIWFGWVSSIYKIKDSLINRYKTSDCGIYKSFAWERIIVRNSDLFFPSNKRDSIIQINPDLPDNKKIYRLTDYGIADTAKVIWITRCKNSLYLMINYNIKKDSIIPYKEIYILNDNGIKKVEFESPDSLNSVWIRNFTVDEEGNLIVFFTVSNGMKLLGKLVYYDNNGKILDTYFTPDFDIKDTLKNFDNADDILYYNNCVWMCNRDLGVLKFSKTTNVNFSNEKTEINNLLINGCYPNPFSNSFNIEFTSSTTSAFSIDLYNILGNKIYTKSLSFLENGANTVNIGPVLNISPGFYFVVVRCGVSVQYLRVFKSE